MAPTPCAARARGSIARGRLHRIRPTLGAVPGRSIASVPDRRRFLKVLAASSLGAAGCSDEEPGPEPLTTGTAGATGGASSGAGASSGSGLPPGFEVLGTVNDIPEGALIAHPSRDVYLGRDELGLYAMTSRCTHEDCNMIQNEGVDMNLDITCGCHGSRFDRYGAVLAGPANAPLPHLALFAADDGTLGIDESTEVPADSRV